MAAVSTICYPAISSYASAAAAPDQQGVSQGVVTGVRGLCYGLGPALFGLIFFLFDVDLESPTTLPPATTPSGVHSLNASTTVASTTAAFNTVTHPAGIQRFIPGPPFAFGAIFVMFAIIIAFFMPRSATMIPLNNSSASSNGSQGGMSRQQKQLTIHLGEIDADDSKQQEQIEPLLDVGSAQE